MASHVMSRVLASVPVQRTELEVNVGSIFLIFKPRTHGAAQSFEQYCNPSTLRAHLEDESEVNFMDLGGDKYTQRTRDKRNANSPPRD